MQSSAAKLYTTRSSVVTSPTSWDSQSFRARIAVIVPCFNEEAAIGRTVADFSAALPGAVIYVYDNNSTDATAAVAQSAGAIVRHARRQGKGHVVRQMFSDVDADVYVMTDGDATYDAAAAPEMVRKLLRENLDMVVGRRRDQSAGAYRNGHRFGNILLTSTLALLFGRHFTDILSGYRVFSRRFVKSFPSLSEGFEIETEISIHALELCMPIGEVDTRYEARPHGSESKLRTYRDGVRILWQIATLFRQERPMAFFGIAGLLFGATSVGLFLPPASIVLEVSPLLGFPVTVLSVGLMILALLSVACGLILDTVTRGRLEVRRLAYLALPPPGSRMTQLVDILEPVVA